MISTMTGPDSLFLNHGLDVFVDVMMDMLASDDG